MGFRRGIPDFARNVPFYLVQSCSTTENLDMSRLRQRSSFARLTAAAAADSVVVSLHDVAPRTQRIAITIISELSAHGVRVCSILVVPNYHHEGPLARYREFVTWLRALEADGHEIVIHGFFHERPPHGKETLRDKFMTRFYTQNEGEFYDLPYKKLCGASRQHQMNSVRSDLTHAVLSRRHGYWEMKQSKPSVMRNWNTRHACARYMISARNLRSRPERLSTVFTIIGGARLVAVGTRHCSV